MISDVLFEAVAEIDRYLDSGFYGPRDDPDALIKRIIDCRNEMEAIRIILDTPPIPSQN